MERHVDFDPACASSVCSFLSLFFYYGLRVLMVVFLVMQAKEKMDSSSESEHDLGQIPPLAMIAHAV